MRWLPALGLLLASGASMAGEPFDIVGLWQFHHTDGSVFHGRLYPDQTATTDFGEGERGIWRREGEAAVRMVYTDGWDDLLLLTDKGYLKQGWAPGADRCMPPTNSTPAERLSSDPDAPLPE